MKKKTARLRPALLRTHHDAGHIVVVNLLEYVVRKAEATGRPMVVKVEIGASHFSAQIEMFVLGFEDAECGAEKRLVIRYIGSINDAIGILVQEPARKARNRRRFRETRRDIGVEV